MTVPDAPADVARLASIEAQVARIQAADALVKHISLRDVAWLLATLRATNEALAACHLDNLDCQGVNRQQAAEIERLRAVIESAIADMQQCDHETRRDYCMTHMCWQPCVADDLRAALRVDAVLRDVGGAG